MSADRDGRAQQDGGEHHGSQAHELLGGLVRAVQSEKGELEIGRVRKFLGGVDGV